MITSEAREQSDDRSLASVSRERQTSPASRECRLQRALLVISKLGVTRSSRTPLGDTRAEYLSNEIELCVDLEIASDARNKSARTSQLEVIDAEPTPLPSD